MDRYQKVEKPKPEFAVNENEIRITSQGLVRNYITYATSLLQERRMQDIVFKAMGQAISKTVAITEIIKRRIPRLHQDTTISSVSITDTFEPIEEGLQTVEQTRHVSTISITLSTKELNKNSPGYQPPSHADQSTRQYNYQPHQPPPRQAHTVYNTGNRDNYERESGRGRGRGRGWSRGGFLNSQDNGEYSNWGRGFRGGRGGWGYHGGGYGGWGGRGRGGGGLGGRGGGEGGRGREGGGPGGRGGGEGGRGYSWGRGRGRMGNRPRGGGYQT